MSFEGKINEQFRLENASNLTHRILYDNSNNKIQQNGSIIFPLKVLNTDNSFNNVLIRMQASSLFPGTIDI